jgi:hypothetical protein
MMAQVVLQPSYLPDGPLEAAARFYAEEIPLLRKLLEHEAAENGEAVDALMIVFPVAGKPHQGWQLAVIQSLARELAPLRVNGLTGGGADALQQATQWLAAAPGITGQLLSVQID